LAVVVFSQHAPFVVHESSDNTHRAVLHLLSAYVLSTMLPSVVFAMPKRAQTTSYVVHTLLMLTGVYAFLACLGAYGLPQYEVVSTHLIMSHLLWAQSAKLSAKAPVLLYQGTVVVLNRLLLLVLIFACAFVSPRKGLENLTLLALLFVPEMLGLLVLVVAFVLRDVGAVFENFMLS